MHCKMITASALLALTLGLVTSPAPAQYVNGPARTEQGEVDLTGGWLQKFHEDNQERREAELGDYTGVPLNEAGRMRADTWDAGKWSVLEHQCEPHPADYAPHGPANFQISKIIDPNSMKTVAIQVIQGWMTSIRTIWLDGRPHPSPNAAYTWQGFSTGRWEGDTLIVTTTHLREGWLRRNGLARSDKAKLTEYWMRHDNILTLVSMLEDPVYLTEPFVRSWNWVLDPGVHMYRYTCEAKLEADRPPNFVAYRPVGKNPFLNEYANKLHVPAIVTRGGSEQMYPEYKDTLRALLSAPEKSQGKSKDQKP